MYFSVSCTPYQHDSMLSLLPVAVVTNNHVLEKSVIQKILGTINIPGGTLSNLKVNGSDESIYEVFGGWSCFVATNNTLCTFMVHICSS